MTALWAFDADQPGTYLVTGEDINRETEFLVGTGNPEAESRAGYRLIKAGSVGIVLAVAVGVAMGLIRRHQTRRRPVPGSRSEGSRKPQVQGTRPSTGAS